MAKIQVWSFYFLSIRAGFANLIPIVSLQGHFPDFLLVQLHNHIWWWGQELPSCSSSGSWVCTCAWPCSRPALNFSLSVFIGETLLQSVITRKVPAPSRAAAETDPAQMEELGMELWNVGIQTPANVSSQISILHWAVFKNKRRVMNPFLDFCCPLLAFFIFNEVTHAVLTGSLCLPLEKMECASLHCCLVWIS